MSSIRWSLPLRLSEGSPRAVHSPGLAAADGGVAGKCLSVTALPPECIWDLPPPTHTSVIFFVFETLAFKIFGNFVSL